MAVGAVPGGSTNPYARGTGPAEGTAPPKTETTTTSDMYDTGGVDPSKRPKAMTKTETDALYNTGTGNAGGTTTTPDVNGAAGGTGSPTKKNALDTINSLSPQTSNSENLQNLGEATNGLARATNESDKEKLKADAEKQKQLAEQKKAQADEAAKKAEEAKKQAEGTKWWGVFKSALNWISSIVTIAAGIALVATGAGAAVGALMIVGGTAGLLNAIDSTVKQATGGSGILGSIAKSLGASDEDAAKWDTGFAITMGVIQLGTSIATFFVNPAQLTSVTAQVATLSAQITGVATGVVSGVGDAVSAVIGYDITGKKAGAMKNQSQAQAADSAMKAIAAAITAATKDNDKIAKSWSNIVNNVQDKIVEQGETTGGTRFTV